MQKDRIMQLHSIDDRIIKGYYVLWFNQSLPYSSIFFIHKDKLLPEGTKCRDMLHVFFHTTKTGNKIIDKMIKLTNKQESISE